MSILLAIDTATSGCGCAVYDMASGALFSENMDTQRGQAEHLMPMIARQMAAAGFADNFAALDGVVVTQGPGSFTGTRIGLATAQGLALSLNIPCVGIPSPTAVFHTYLLDNRAKPDVEYFVVLETKRSDFVIQKFTASSGTLSDMQALEAEDVLALVRESTVGEKVFIGDALERMRDALKELGEGTLKEVGDALYHVDKPNPEVLAKLGQDALQNTDACTGQMPAPIYLKPPKVSMPKRS